MENTSKMFEIGDRIEYTNVLGETKKAKVIKESKSTVRVVTDDYKTVSLRKCGNYKMKKVV